MGPEVIKMRAIYERGELRSKRFRADWQSDSSGYTVMESVEGRGDRVRVFYEAESGKRSVLESNTDNTRSEDGQLSPDGKRVLFSKAGELEALLCARSAEIV